MNPDGDVLIDTARPGDAKDLARVYVDTWRNTFAGILPDRVLLTMEPAIHEVRFNRWLNQRTERQFILTARAADNRIVGFSKAGPGRGQPHTFGEIYLLYIEPDWQERGIGKRLLRRSFKGLWDGGYGRALLWTLADSPSRFFYEAQGGFRTSERIEHLWGADLREVCYLWRDLTAY